MEWVQNVFGVHSAAQIDIDRTSLPVLDNTLSVSIRSVIDSVRQQRHRCMRVSVQCVSTVVLRLLYIYSAVFKLINCGVLSEGKHKLQVSEYKVLNKIFVPKKDEVNE
jgi:hypothetical protein